MNPFGEMSSSHNTWPVTLCIYNLLPWLCMKWKFIMMLRLIPGPKQPSNDIDVYLRPLVKELLLLWHEEGVRMWDEYRQENFNLWALLFITINDWPTLSNLSGQTNKGHRSCTHCLDETDSVYLTHYKKVIYRGHHRFLPIKHHLQRREGKHVWMLEHPSGYSLNIKGILNMPEKKFTNLKYHDCHVLITNFLRLSCVGFCLRTFD
jgi:hypothetical protein